MCQEQESPLESVIWIYYEKVWQGQQRWCYLALGESLFDDVILVRQWGRVGQSGGRKRVDIFDDESERLRVWKRICATRRRHGYSVVKTAIDAHEETRLGARSSTRPTAPAQPIGL
jgi:predicted DNA-binding WGR domain protein